MNRAERTEAAEENPDAARAAYEGAVLPANRLPEGNRDLNPAGLYHLLGNVAEWTESIPFQYQVPLSVTYSWKSPF